MRRMGRLLLFLFVVSLGISVGCRTTQSPEDQMNDAAITAEVKAKLASDVRLATLTNIDVTTVNGVVTLAGQVRTGEESQRAEQVVKSIQGVKQINNNLQVVPPTG